MIVSDAIPTIEGMLLKPVLDNHTTKSLLNEAQGV